MTCTGSSFEPDIRRILVVDDFEEIRNLIDRSLKALGYLVDQAESVTEAYKLIDLNDYDVILTDKNMPGIDDNPEGGMDILRFVRSRELSTEVIMITGKPTVETISEALNLGAFDYMEKPFSLREVHDKVERIRELRRFIDHDGMLARYRDIRRELVNLIAKNSSMPVSELITAISPLQLEIDKVFELIKESEKMALILRESLAKIAAQAEVLQSMMPDTDPCRDTVADILSIAKTNL